MSIFIKSVIFVGLISSIVSASPFSWIANKTRSATGYIKGHFNSYCDHVGEAVIENQCGARPVSKKLDVRIRSILKKIGFKHHDTLNIRQIARVAMFSGIGDHNAFVIHLGPLPRYMYVNESWFWTLSDEEQEFLIAHETMHLVYHHSTKKILFALVSAIGITIGFQYIRDYVKTTAFNDYIQDWWSELYLLVPISIGFSQIAFSRFCERQADMEAARALGTADGGCMLMNNFEEYLQELDAELPQRPDLVEKRKSDREWYGSHPTCETRKNYLKNMKLAKRKVVSRKRVGVGEQEGH